VTVPEPACSPAPFAVPALAEEPSGLAVLIPRRDPARRTRLVGILNLTPDSFHDGGRLRDPADAVARARELVAAGADALDVGGESTRPGATPVGAAEEWARLAPVLADVVALGVPVSVDTTKAEVAARALDAGAALVNDVSGLRHDPQLAAACASRGAGLVLMHSRGEPRTMQSLTLYADVVLETRRFLEDAMERAVRAGVAESRIILDPGLGFAKTAEQNLEILRRLPEYLTTGRPILVGASRKSFLGRHDAPDSADRLEGTLATSVIAVLGGASLLRVHDVRENRRAVSVTEAVLRAPSSASGSGGGVA
jgi:dihydropteroate synthase